MAEENERVPFGATVGATFADRKETPPPEKKPAEKAPKAENAEEGSEEREAETSKETDEKPKPKPRDHEAEARAHGWMPFDEWVEKGRDPEEWNEPLVYNVRRDFIRDQKRDRDKIKSLAEQVEESVRFNKRQMEIHDKELDEAIRKAKAEFKAAVREGDEAVITAAEKKVDDLQKEKAEIPKEPPKAAPTAPEPSETFRIWAKENVWWNTNLEARNAAVVEANVAEMHIRRKKGSYDPISDEPELLKTVTNRMRDTWPDLFPAGKEASRPGSTPPKGERARGSAPENADKGAKLTKAEMAYADAMGIPHEKYAASLQIYDKARSR